MNPIYNFTLDLQSAVSQVTLSARRGDRVRLASVTLASGGVPYEIEHGCYAVVNAKYESDVGVKANFIDCVIKDNSIEFNVGDIAKGAEGCVDCDITLYSPSGEAITSPKFAVVVYAGTTTGDDIEGAGEYKTLYDIYSEVMDAKERAETAAVQAAAGGAVSFNGRVGAVVPEVGDYDADMVGAEPAGAAGSAVEAHDADVNAHFGMFAADEHSHTTKDVSDFEDAVSSAIATYGAAKIAFGALSSDGKVVGLAFAPQLIILQWGNNNAEATMCCAVRSEVGAIEVGRKHMSEGNYSDINNAVNVTWKTNGAEFEGLCNNEGGYGGYRYVAIG